MNPCRRLNPAAPLLVPLLTRQPTLGMPPCSLAHMRARALNRFLLQQSEPFGAVYVRVGRTRENALSRERRFLVNARLLDLSRSPKSRLENSREALFKQSDTRLIIVRGPYQCSLASSGVHNGSLGVS